jgi:hypothetical protein
MADIAITPWDFNNSQNWDSKEQANANVGTANHLIAEPTPPPFTFFHVYHHASCTMMNSCYYPFLLQECSSGVQRRIGLVVWRTKKLTLQICMDLSGYLFRCTPKIMVLLSKNLNNYINILICYKNDTTVVWSHIFSKKCHTLSHTSQTITYSLTHPLKVLLCMMLIHVFEAL